MKLYARTRWAIYMLCAFVSAAGAQLTAPVPTAFTLRAPTEDILEEISGDPLPSSDPVTYMVERSDTIPPFTLNAEVMAVDSPNVTLSYTVNYNGTVHPARRITQHSHAQFWLPDSGTLKNEATMPDSFLTVRLNNSQTVGNKFRLSRRPTAPGTPYWIEFEYAQDTTKGTAQDTSYVYKFADGIEEMTLGIWTDYATPEIRLMLQVNSGMGWGNMNPADTLAYADWTNDVAASTWQYRRLTNLPSARWYRLIRIGETAADTGIVRTGAYIVPQRKAGGQ